MTTKEIKKIQLGETVTYQCRNARHAESVKELAHRAARLYPELGLKFRTSINYARSEITIVAIPPADMGRQRVVNL